MSHRWQTGAAYNPSTVTWRKLAPAPLSGGTDVGSTWSGTEWWVAAGNRSGATDIAAYNPATNSWRSLPSIPDEFADTPSIAWSGSEVLLLTAAGLFSMPTDGTEWVAELQPTELQGPAIWTGDQFVALASTEYGSDPLASDYLTYPVGWDPSTRSTVELALPPRNVYDPVQASSRLAFFNQGLALDLTTDSWVTLSLDAEAIKALELAGHTSVWLRIGSLSGAALSHVENRRRSSARCSN